MTDNQIVKALECCAGCVKAATCRRCPYRKREGDCIVRLSRDALDLINRQQAEIERLEKDKENLAYSFANAVGRNLTVKEEAIKEFAKRLKEDISGHRLEMYMNGLKGTPRTHEITYEYVEEYIDNLLKETVAQ